MGTTISVDIDELIERLKLAKDEGFSIVQLEISDSMIEEDETLTIRALEPVSGDVTDFGIITFENGEI